MNLYTYVNFAEDEAKKPKKKSFLRKHWKKLALGAAGLGVGVLGGVALANHLKNNKTPKLARDPMTSRENEERYKSNVLSHLNSELSRTETEIDMVKHQLQQYIDASRSGKLNQAEQAAKAELHSKLGNLIRKKKDLQSQIASTKNYGGSKY